MEDINLLQDSNLKDTTLENLKMNGSQDQEY